MNTDKLHVMFYKRIFVFNLYNVFINKPSPFFSSHIIPFMKDIFSSKLENWNVWIGKLILFPSKKRLLMFFTISFINNLHEKWLVYLRAIQVKGWWQHWWRYYFSCYNSKCKVGFRKKENFKKSKGTRALFLWINCLKG